MRTQTVTIHRLSPRWLVRGTTRGTTNACTTLTRVATTLSAAAPNGRPADRQEPLTRRRLNMTRMNVGRGRSRRRTRRAAVNTLAVEQRASSVRPTSDGRPATIARGDARAARRQGVGARSATHGPRLKPLGPSLLSTGRQIGRRGGGAATQVPRCENLVATFVAPEKLWETRGPRAFSFVEVVR